MPSQAIDGIYADIRADVSDLTQKIPQAARVVDQSMSQIERSAKRAENVVVISSGRMANAQRNLGRQISDIGTQLAGGQSPFVILAQQAPQVADALADTEGKAKSVASFFAGPWGAALLAATSILGLLASAALEAGEAEETHGKAAKSLSEAMREMSEATKGAISTSQQNERQQYLEAGALLAKALAARKATLALLEEAKSRAEASRITQTVGNGGLPGVVGSVAGAQEAFANRTVAELNKQIEKQNALIKEGGENVRRAGIPILQRQAAEATDKATAATGRYDRALGKLNERFSAGKISREGYQAEVERLNRTRDSQLDAIRDAEREARKKPRAKKKEPAFDPNAALAEGLQNTFFELEQETRKTIANIFAGDDLYDQARAYNEKLIDVQRDGAKEVADYTAQVQRDQVLNVAALYEEAFRGGTDRIWDNFKDIGLQIISQVLAEFTISSLGGKGGFNLGKSLSNAVTSIFSPGKAVGGTVAPNSLQWVGENGPEILRMGSTAGTIHPNASVRGMGGSTIISAPRFDLSGAIITRELYADMQRISDESAARAGNASYKQSMRDAPTAVRRSQRYGGGR